MIFHTNERPRRIARLRRQPLHRPEETNQRDRRGNRDGDEAPVAVGVARPTAEEQEGGENDGQLAGLDARIEGNEARQELGPRRLARRLAAEIAGECVPQEPLS